MKALFVTAGMDGGGTERVIAVLANYMVQHGHDVTILMTVGEESVYELDNRIKLAGIGERTGGRIGKRVERIRKIRRYFREDKERVILSFGIETNLFSILAGLLLKNKILVSERNDPNRCSYPAIRNLLYQFADGFVFQTKAAQQCFGRNIRKKSVVIANPVKDSLPEPFQGERRKRISAVGRLEPQKNHKLLISAFAEFYKTHPDYELFIYGKGELQRELQELAEQSGISSQVKFPGFAKNVPEQIKADAMYVLSSDYEGISNSLMEAMAIGMPVISTDCPIGGSALLIQSGVSGILTPVGDTKALTEAMCRIADEPEKAQKMAQRAQEIRETYSTSKICTQWMEFIGWYVNI